MLHTYLDVQPTRKLKVTFIRANVEIFLNTKLSILRKLQSMAENWIEGAEYKDGRICGWIPVKELIKHD